MVPSTKRKQGKWILARRSDAFPGIDNHERVSKVHIGDQEQLWSISKLCPLECKDLYGVGKLGIVYQGKGECLSENIMAMEFYISKLTKQMKFQEHSRIKDIVEKYA